MSCVSLTGLIPGLHSSRLPAWSQKQFSLDLELPAGWQSCQACGLGSKEQGSSNSNPRLECDSQRKANKGFGWAAVCRAMATRRRHQNVETVAAVVFVKSKPTMELSRQRSWSIQCCRRPLRPVALVAAGAVLCFRRALCSSAGDFGASSQDHYRLGRANAATPALFASQWSGYVVKQRNGERIRKHHRLTSTQINFTPRVETGFNSFVTSASWGVGRHYSSSNKNFDSDTDNISPKDESQSTLLSRYSHLPRIFIDSMTSSTPIGPNSLVTLSPSQSHYLQTVMRLSNPKRWGDLANHVRIFNGRDGEWLAKILQVDDVNDNQSSTSRRRQRRQVQDDEASVIAQAVDLIVPQPSPSPYKVTLWMAAPKKQRRRWILEKVTELGIDGIGFIQTDFSQDELGTKNKNRKKDKAWSSSDENPTKDIAYVIEASEQCERYTIPSILLKQVGDDDEDDDDYDHPITLSEIIESKWIKGDNDNLKLTTNILTCWLICRERSPSSDSILKVLDDLVDNAANNCFDRSINVEGSNEPPPSVPALDINLLVGPEG